MPACLAAPVPSQCPHPCQPSCRYAWRGSAGMFAGLLAQARAQASWCVVRRHYEACTPPSEDATEQTQKNNPDV